METILRRFIEWKYPEHNKRLRLIKVQKEVDNYLVIYSFKARDAHIMSKMRHKRTIRVSLWDMVEFNEYRKR
jgi:hypothetical protein